jgi:hypothetical protein
MMMMARTSGVMANKGGKEGGEGECEREREGGSV